MKVKKRAAVAYEKQTGKKMSGEFAYTGGSLYTFTLDTGYGPHQTIDEHLQTVPKRHRAAEIIRLIGLGMGLASAPAAQMSSSQESRRSMLPTNQPVSDAINAFKTGFSEDD